VGRGGRRCRRRGSPMRATARAAAAAAAAESLAGAPPPPPPRPCLTARASRSARGSPSASEFFTLSPFRGLDCENPPVWILRRFMGIASLIRRRPWWLALFFLSLQCDHGGDAEHQHREVLHGHRAPHPESGETAF
jgi:hypothetical protein